MTVPSILVVDDQPINVQLLKRKMEREGMRVTAAYNGMEALASVQKELPDLILLDVMMPDMDGIEVCQRLQANETTRATPVIFITARPEKEKTIGGPWGWFPPNIPEPPPPGRARGRASNRPPLPPPPPPTRPA